MKRAHILPTILVALLGLAACQANHHPQADVIIQTSMGNIEVMLYEDTPLHRANFIQLAQEGFFEDLLFHRVIEKQMIQGGDPSSRNAPTGTILGKEEAPYQLSAEFLPHKYIHKRGALAAARKVGLMNPEKRSSGSQFYFVWGNELNRKSIQQIYRLKNEQLEREAIQQLIAQNPTRMETLEQLEDLTPLTLYMDSLSQQVKSQLHANQSYYQINDSLIALYDSLGGLPFLDGDYTVFGEVVQGLEVLEQIQKVTTDPNDRPLTDIKMNIEIL